MPQRGRPNVPANVRYTAAFLAELRETTLEGLEPILDANARRVFGLPDGRVADYSSQRAD